MGSRIASMIVVSLSVCGQWEGGRRQRERFCKALGFVVAAEAPAECDAECCGHGKDECKLEQGAAHGV